MRKSAQTTITAIDGATMGKMVALVIAAGVVLLAQMENFGQAWSLLNSQ